MEFVSLLTILTSIADRIDLPPHTDSQGKFIHHEFQLAVDEFWLKHNECIERNRKLSIAALWLNEVLEHPKGKKPRWLKFDEKKRFEVNCPDDWDEGINTLTATTNKGSDFLEKCSTTIRNFSDGYNIDGVKAASLTIRTAEENRELIEIGFELQKIVQFLEENQIENTLQSEGKLESKVKSPNDHPIQKTPAKSETPNGLSSRAVLATDWPLTPSRKFNKNSLKNALSDVPKWIAPARVTIGGPGVSSTWNPVQLGVQLHEKGLITKSQLDRHLNRYFSEWLDEWEETKYRL